MPASAATTSQWGGRGAAGGLKNRNGAQPKHPGGKLSDSTCAVRKFANRTLRVWHGAGQEMPLDDVRIPNVRGVRAALGSGYTHARGIGRTSRNGRESDRPPETATYDAGVVLGMCLGLCPTVRFATFSSLDCGSAVPNQRSVLVLCSVPVVPQALCPPG